MYETISNDTRKKIREFILGGKTKWFYDMSDCYEGRIFSPDRYPDLIKFIELYGKSDLECGQADIETLKACKNTYIDDYSKMRLQSSYFYSEKFALFSRQSKSSFTIIDAMSRTHEMLMMFQQIEYLELKKTVCKKFNLTIEEIFESIYIIFLIVVAYDDYSERLLNGLNFLTTQENENIVRICKHLTCKEEKLTDISTHTNKFFIKKNKKLICFNAIALMIYLADGVYWLCRDLYKENKLFIREKGKVFARYVEKVFATNDIKYICLDDKSSGMRVNKDIRADYVVEADNYCLIIEVKCMEAPFILKTDDNKDEQYRSLRGKYAHAFKQLSCTEKYLKNKNKHCGLKKFVKIILTTENFYSSVDFKNDILKNEIEVKKENIMDPEDYFFCPIGAFESLMYMLNNRESDFNYIIEEKISNEKKLKEGKWIDKKYRIKAYSTIQSDKVETPLIDIENILIANKKYYMINVTMGNKYLSGITKKVGVLLK